MMITQDFETTKTLKLSRMIGNTPMIKISDKIYLSYFQESHDYQ